MLEGLEMFGMLCMPSIASSRGSIFFPVPDGWDVPKSVRLNPQGKR